MKFGDTVRWTKNPDYIVMYITGDDMRDRFGEFIALTNTELADCGERNEHTLGEWLDAETEGPWPTPSES